MSGYRYTGEKLPPDEIKKRMHTSRNKMREQDPRTRARNFEEVNLGYDAKTAMKEAKRCLLCPTSPCVGRGKIHRGPGRDNAG